MRAKNDILLSIICAQGETLRTIENEIAAEEDSFKQKCRGDYINLTIVKSFFSRLRITMQKCRGAIAIFTDEYKRKAR